MTYFLVARNKSISVGERAQSGQFPGKAPSSSSGHSTPNGHKPDTAKGSDGEDTTEDPETRTETEEKVVDGVNGGSAESIQIETQVEIIAETMQNPPAVSRKQQVVDLVKRNKGKIAAVGAAGTAAVIWYLLSHQRGSGSTSKTPKEKAMEEFEEALSVLTSENLLKTPWKLRAQVGKLGQVGYENAPLLASGYKDKAGLYLQDFKNAGREYVQERSNAAGEYAQEKYNAVGQGFQDAIAPAQDNLRWI
jgi:hypothetical protein